ncbi:hypothetical protein GC177_01700 [bacterium]|nr:hypothetical protein [bacterium]
MLNPKNMTYAALVTALLGTAAVPALAVDVVAKTTTTTTRAVTPADWAAEEAYWRSNYNTRPYATTTTTYTTYEPAYRYGYDVYTTYNGRPIDQISDEELRAGWMKAHSNTTLTWEQARPAVKDAYDRLNKFNTNRDGRTAVNANTQPAR